MTVRARVAALLVVATAAIGVAVGGASDTDAARWWSHVRFLADDALEGRDTGSPGYQRAADYVAGLWRKAGLEPAFSGQFVQTVAFKTRQIDESRSSLALVRDGRVEPLSLGDDAYFSLRVDPAVEVNAPLVFTSRGLDIPEAQINDLAGLNLKGAVAVYLSTQPPSLSGTLQEHFGSNAERWRMLRAAGAIGTIAVPGSRRLEVPWSRSTIARLQPQMSLAEAALDEYPDQRIAVTMNPERADKLFEGSGHTLSELTAADQSGQPLPRFVLPARVKASVAVTRSMISPKISRASCAAPTPNCVTRPSSCRRTSITSASASRWPATGSITARWTTHRAWPPSSKSPHSSTSPVSGRPGRSSSWPSPARSKASLAPDISSHTRPRAQRLSPT
jgi:hypothetical protein